MNDATSSRIREVVDLLCSESTWSGFRAVRQLIPQLDTRGKVRAFTSAVEQANLVARSDFRERLVRIAVVGSESTDNLMDAMTLQTLERGLFCYQYHAPFGQMSQEIRNTASGLYQHEPDIVVLVPSVSSFLPRGARRDVASATAVVDSVLDGILVLRKSFRGLIVVQNFLPPENRPMGVLDCKEDLGVADFHRQLSLLLSERCRELSGTYVLDANYLSATCGLEWVTLHKSSFLGGRTIPEPLTIPLAREIAALGAALKGFGRKCLVTDLDNTLWGGIAGEDGVAGIRVGGGYPGNVFLALQQAILDLHERGVILCVNSKNNERDAWEVFESRSEMLLKKGHFSAWRINWQDKVKNLREIAEELNIGLDSLVVLDDNPAEREWIEAALPAVHVIPADEPLQMARYLATSRLFDTLTASSEDALRAKSYSAAAARRSAAAEADDINGFLLGLEVVVDIGPASLDQFGRIAQLTQKTNQFNLTTRRYAEGEIAKMAASPDWSVFYCGCRDKFADEGLIGVAIVRRDQVEWRIDTFLMSCRALGRGVERAFLGWIFERARKAGAILKGEFIRSKKNAQVANFFRDNGFKAVAATEEFSSWELAVPPPVSIWPDWIARAQDKEMQFEHK